MNEPLVLPRKPAADSVNRLAASKDTLREDE